MILIFGGKGDPDDEVHVSQYGTYSIRDNLLSYSWQYRVKCIKGKTETTSNHALSFEGERRFRIEDAGDVTRLVSESPNRAEFRFMADRLEYFETDKLIRVWRRL